MELSTKRHSLAHILAQAVQRDISTDTQLGIWPAIDTWSYYDMLFGSDVTITSDHLSQLEQTITKIIKEGQDFCLLPTTPQQSLDILTMTNQIYKQEMRQEFLDRGDAITFYINTIKLAAKDALLKDVDPWYIQTYDQVTAYIHQQYPEYQEQYVTFIDMCAGPHISNTKELDPKACKLDKLAGAYWKWNEHNVMMTRIYLLAFEDKQSLQAHLTMLEEARKRDHRILGPKLKIFTLSDLVGSGLPLFQPNGMTIRRELTDYLWELHKDHGYQWVWTPHLAKEALYECSGHAGHYLDDMFRVHGGTSDEDFFLKPMNCPHHMQLFADNQFSYRDMPVRYFEPATVYRDEKTGQLSGLTRVRAITQDDGHLYCRIWQLKEEITTIVHIVKQFYTTMGMMDAYRVSLSVRGEDQSKYLGSEENRVTAEWALQEICDELQLSYRKIEGEAAFYGPKLDFQFKDAIGREWQLATIQVDFNQPERFDLSFINEQWEKERPVVIHRAVSGSLERFIGVMIEHFAGAFPLWLAPIQAKILPVATTFLEYGNQIYHLLKQHNIRVQIDDSGDSLGKQIRNAELAKIPYMLVIGQQEVDTQTVTFRSYKTKEQVTSPLTDMIERLTEEYDQRSL
jgi:threonyl-tRNA synthetase